MMKRSKLERAYSHLNMVVKYGLHAMDDVIDKQHLIDALRLLEDIIDESGKENARATAQEGE